MTFSATDPPTEWDEGFAGELEGAVVLAGITYAEPAGERMEQFYGVVEQAVRGKGVLLSLRGSRDGETFWVPPDLSQFHPAGPGSYRLRATGEVVVDPDYTTTWTIYPPKS